MQALHLVTSWPVDHVSAAVVLPDRTERIGDSERVHRLASLSKPMSAWAIMVGVEEGIVFLDAPMAPEFAPPDATLRHLLAHAAGYPFDGAQPIAGVGRKRIYSNTGIEHAAGAVAAASGMPFADYLREAVFEPLAMSTAQLRGSPAHAVWSSADDAAAFVAEMLQPRLLAPETVTEITRPQFADLSGIVPDVGRFDPCPWGLGVEILGDKSPHWMGRANSPATFGHFGGAGTMMWADPTARVGVVALTDRPFDEWRDNALRSWQEFSDAVLAEVRSER